MTTIQEVLTFIKQNPSVAYVSVFTNKREHLHVKKNVAEWLKKDGSVVVISHSMLCPTKKVVFNKVNYI